MDKFCFMRLGWWLSFEQRAVAHCQKSEFLRCLDWRGNWKRLKAAATALGTGLAVWGASAETHTLPLTMGGEGDWLIQARVQGRDAKFWQEGEANGSHVILYTVPKELEVSVFADYTGSLPEGISATGLSLEMNPQDGVEWTMEGGIATSVVNLTLHPDRLNEGRILSGRAVLHTTDPYWTYTVLFHAFLDVARPISVSGHVSGGSIWLYTYAVGPCIVTNTAGASYLDYRSTPVGGADVKAEAVSGISISSGWETTDEAGRAKVAAAVETCSEVDAAGYVQAKVLLKATKDRASVEREQNLTIPYAIVVAANGASLVGHEGGIMDPSPIYSGAVLQPGDVVQVGSEVLGTGMSLTVQFCNGQTVFFQSDTIGGLRAVVGHGSLDHQTSVLKVSLNNFAQAVSSDPRRYGRMVVYKALGNAVDGFLGIPDPVGWTVKTPGGAVEEWVSDYVESSYQPRSSRLTKGAVEPFSGSSPAADAAWAGLALDLYNDNTVRVFNHGATVRLRGPSSQQTLSAAGMTVARLDVEGGVIYPTGLAPVSTAVPQVTSIEPAPGATEVAIRPRLRMQFSEVGGNSVLPGSLISRLDGRLIDRNTSLNENEINLQLPASEALRPGLHQWDTELATQQGAVLRTSITFRVTGNLPAPQGLTAVAGLDRVGLRWDPEALAWARGGFRVYRTPQGGPAGLISGPNPLQQPNFVDPNPLPNASYQAAGLDEAGNEGPRSSAVAVTFPGMTPPTPGTLTVAAESADPGPGYALAMQDATHGFTLWRIEAATNSTGPFVDVLSGELTSLASWPMPRPFEETRPWFRVTSLNVDGQTNATAMVGPLALPAALPPVAGLTAALNDSRTVTLCWDPWTVRPFLGYRVERWDGAAWTTAANLGSGSLTWTDTAPAGGELRQWRIRARVADGETPCSSGVALRWQPVPAQPGSIRFASASQTGAEGETVSVRLVREGGSDGPAFVTWSTWSAWGTATPDVDYTPGAGLLVFQPGETEKTVAVPLLTDSLYERPDKYLKVQIRNVEGGPALDEPSTTQVFITEGASLAWQSTWMYADETGSPQVQFTVTLSSPVNHQVTVDYTLDPLNTTGTLNEDFTGPLSGSLTFAPGQTSQSFVVTVIDDAVKEGTTAEKATYRLLNPQGAGIDDTDPFLLYATLQITDDDSKPGQPVFDDHELQLREGESRTLTLRRVGGADGSLMVFLFSMGGTAQQGTDWTLEPSFLSFADGQTELAVTLNTADDGLPAGNKLLVLGLQGMGAHGPGNMPTLPVIITDSSNIQSGFAAWADQRLAGLPESQRQPLADPDGDGRPNWIEFLWLADPTTPDRLAQPQITPNPWGGMQVIITVADDPACLVVAEFSDGILWTASSFSAGTWQSNSDGTHTGTFNYFSTAPGASFVRFRCYLTDTP